MNRDTFIYLVLLIWLLNPLLADQLDLGYQAMSAGKLSKARSLFSEVTGEFGQVARARLALVEGYPERAIREVPGDSVAHRVTRLQALCEAGRFTKARNLLRALEREVHSSFPYPYNFRFYLQRGLIEERSQNPELARKNYQLARKIARSANDHCVVLNRLTSLWIGQQELEKATDAYLETASLIHKVTDKWIFIKHLGTGYALDYEKGSLAAAAAQNRAVRELYLAYSNPVKAASALFGARLFTDYANDFEQSFLLTKQTIDELLESKSYREAGRRLESFKTLYFKLGSTRDKREFKRLFEGYIARIPEGAERERAQLSYLKFLADFSTDSETTINLAQRLARSKDPSIVSMAHQLASRGYRHKGDYDNSRRSLEMALSIAPQQMLKADRYWECARGPILLKLSELEKNQHNFDLAKDLAKRGIEDTIGPDWTFWRVQAHNQALLLHMQTFDSSNATTQMKLAIKDIEQLPRASEKAAAFTTMLAALQLNQSVEDEVIDPSDFLLGSYSDMAQDMLAETFSSTETTTRFLGYFDEWQRAAEDKREILVQSFPLVYKGLFLEAVGQLGEAKITLLSGLKSATENGVLPGQMLAQVLLARIAFRQNRSALAVDYLTEASKAAENLNPEAARFYLLVAGAAQRNEGRLKKALESFNKALELAPQSGMSALYGRALTLEKMNRLDSALEDVKKARELVRARGKDVLLARLDSLKARLVAAQGNFSDAVSLYSSAHQILLEKEVVDPLYQLTPPFVDFLLANNQKKQALQLLSRTLDKLSEWHVLNFRQGEPLLRRVVGLALELGEEEKALRYLQLSRSVEFLDSISLEDVQCADEKTQELLKEVSSLRKQLTRLREDTPASGQRNEVGQLVAKTRQKFFLKLSELRQSEPDFEALVQLSGSQLSAIQQLLSEESALVEYFPAKSSLYIFVVTRHEFTLHQVSISRFELERIIDRHKQLTSRPEGQAGERKRISRALRALLLDSFKERLVGMQNLRLVPSGAIWDVSFSSLLGEDSEPVVNKYEVSYITSSDLARLRRTGSGPSSKPRRALLVSGTDDLPGARNEIQTLAGKLPNSLVLSGANLTRADFSKELTGRDLVHIASHSRVATSAGRSYVELGQDQLSLEQIYGLELEPWSLVVLSSCKSGVGESVPSKEVTSLASAFSVAGASTVVASRWEVDDTTTAEFFNYFYDSLLEGNYRGEAFRQAEMKMAKRHPHPYYWAGFCLLGDPD